MKLTRTLALSLLVSLLFFGSANLVSAEGDWDWYTARTDSSDSLNKSLKAITESEQKGIPSHESFVDNNLLNVQASALLYTAGAPESAMQGMSEEEKRIVYERYGKGGVIGQVTNGIVALYTPPASSGTYVADLLHSAHIVPKAQAQGLGFVALDPILETWKVFRNVAYLFFVVIFLVIGFMIMFRQKIGGQTVVTAQQAIPGIIISLIFVTFSYAIAGFMIDLMYLLMYLMIGLFSASGGTEWLNKNIFQVGMDLVIGKEAVFGTVSQAVSDFTGAITIGLGDTISGALGWIAGITLALVVSIAILIATFKIFFELLKTYVSVVISIATAPLLLMLGAMPGQNNFFKWVKGVAGNLLAFPMVLMAFIVYDMFTRNSGSEGGFLPPFLPGRGSGSAIITLVGIGILLVIPDLIKEIKKLFGAEGGIWETLAKQAGENVKGALRPTHLAATIGATAIGGAGGALIRGTQQAMSGEGNFRERARRFGQGAIEGAAIGGGGGLAILQAPTVIKRGAKLIGTQLENIAQREVTEKWVDRIKEKAGKEFQIRQAGAIDQQEGARGTREQRPAAPTKQGNRF